MLQSLKRFLAELTQPTAESSPAEQAHAQQLATAVLLVEVMRAEPTLDETERDAILRSLQTKFGLSGDELQGLLDLAHDRAKTAYDYQAYTRLLNERFSQAQKIAVVEAMWQVAYADAHLDVHENHVISKVAGLLHVTHGEYIAAKMRAKESAAAR